MATPKNYYVYSLDVAYIDRLEEEYKFIGRDCKKIDGGLVVFAIARKPRKKVDPKDSKDRKPRDLTGRN